MASADVGFRVLDGAGDVLLAGGSLADRNLRVGGEGADDVEGFVELVSGGSLPTGLPGFQLKLRSGDRLLVSLDDAAQSGILRRMIFGTLATLGAAALFGVAVGRLVVRRDAARLREILDRTERLAVTRRLARSLISLASPTTPIARAATHQNCATRRHSARQS